VVVSQSEEVLRQFNDMMVEGSHRAEPEGQDQSLGRPGMTRWAQGLRIFEMGLVMV